MIFPFRVQVGYHFLRCCMDVGVRFRAHFVFACTWVSAVRVGIVRSLAFRFRVHMGECCSCGYCQVTGLLLHMPFW